MSYINIYFNIFLIKREVNLFNIKFLRIYIFQRDSGCMITRFN